MRPAGPTEPGKPQLSLHSWLERCGQHFVFCPTGDPPASTGPCCRSGRYSDTLGGLWVRGSFWECSSGPGMEGGSMWVKKRDPFF